MGIDTARPSGFGGRPRFFFIVGLIVDRLITLVYNKKRAMGRLAPIPRP
jgi:hypothetical protein